MSDQVSLSSLDLAALLCSRVCHDLISPAGAIVNGLEVLEESKDEETKSFALDLIRKSAQTASARLQFCRIAFGAAGSARAEATSRSTPSAKARPSASRSRRPVPMPACRQRRPCSTAAARVTPSTPI